MAFTLWIDKNRRVLRGWTSGIVQPSTGISASAAAAAAKVVDMAAVSDELAIEVLSVPGFESASINQQRSTAA